MRWCSCASVPQGHWLALQLAGVLLTGCNAFFQIDEVALHDAKVVDAAIDAKAADALDAPIDAPSNAIGCSTGLDHFALPVIADTYLDSAGMAPHGADTLLQVGPEKVVLVKVATGGNRIARIDVSFPALSMGFGCDAGDPGSCGTCAATGGAYSIGYIASGWNESAATWTNRTAIAMWLAAGAASDGGEFCNTATNGTEFTCSIGVSSALYSFDNTFTVALRSSGNVSATFLAREGTQCNLSQPRPKVVVTCATCGNGRIDTGEDCDDPNDVNGDGCDTNCTVSSCGNGVITIGEECDDGNANDGDGCDVSCHLEAPALSE